MSEPLPCPFCGEAPDVSPTGVRCLSINCSSKPHCESWSNREDESDFIARWNTRAPVKLKPCGSCGRDTGNKRR